MSIYSQRFFAMGSNANEIRIHAPNQVLGNGLMQLVVAEVQRIEIKYSRYRPDSVIAKINAQAGGDWQSIDAETLALAQYAQSLFTASEGLFDLTSGVLRQIWDFKKPQLPTPAQLQAILPLIGQHHLQVEGERWRLAKSGMEIDFGGIGKEYAADRAAAVLQEQGVEFGYINLGGDIAVLGPRPDGQPWSIAIPDPRNNSILASIDMTQGGIATSGDYERFFELDGQRYCHVLNPKTGLPVTYWQSVTVIGPSASVAGSCASVAMLLEEGALPFLEDSGLSFLAVDRHGQLHQSDSTR